MNLTQSVSSDGQDDRFCELCARLGIPEDAEIIHGQFAYYKDEDGAHMVDVLEESRKAQKKVLKTRLGFDYEWWQSHQLFGDSGRFAPYLNSYGTEDERSQNAYQESFMNVRKEFSFVECVLAAYDFLSCGDNFDFKSALYTARIGDKPNYDRMNN